jgi:hypothetical protein
MQGFQVAVARFCIHDSKVTSFILQKIEAEITHIHPSLRVLSHGLLNMNTILSPFVRHVRMKSFDLLPDELLHLILAQPLFVDYDMFSHRSPAQLLARRVETTSLSLVCHRWRRVVVPIIYETVILTSESEAIALASMVRCVGPYIKKLRIEGGYGNHIYTILSNIPGLAFICVYFNIPSKGKAGGLCRGLKLINPRHVILLDAEDEVLDNQGVENVVNVLIECMTSVWSNMVGVPLDMFFFHVLTVLIRFHTIIRMMNIGVGGKIAFLTTLKTSDVIRALQL